jgi:ectoine hydroxylase-related dioxygenase (phytanoyl-CoA dioxygenase family)
MGEVTYYGVLEQHYTSSDIILRAAEEVTNLGYTVIDSGYDPSQLEKIDKAFDIVYAKYVERYNYSFLEKVDEINGIRLPLAFDQLFLELAFNQVVLSLVKYLIKGKFYLNQQNGVINPPRKRYNQDAFHRDLPYQHFVSSRPLAISALFCVDEFTKHNGATVVIPFSHKREEFPSNDYAENHSLVVEAPVGSFIVFDSMLFHKGGVNSTEKPRRAINHVYTIPYLKQQINIPNTLGLVHKFNDYQAEILGYKYQVPLNIDNFFKSRQSKI